MRYLFFVLVLLLAADPASARPRVFAVNQSPAAITTGPLTLDLAGTPDSTLFVAEWEDPRPLGMVNFTFDRLTAVDADSSVVVAEFLLMSPDVLTSGLTDAWNRDVEGTDGGVYMNFVNSTGDLGFAASSDGYIALDNVNALSATRAVEYVQGVRIVMSPQNLVDPDALGANGDYALSYLRTQPVYGVRLRYIADPTLANNTGSYSLSMSVSFQ